MSELGERAQAAYEVADEVPRRQCDPTQRGCGAWLPLNDTFFHRDGEGFRHVCKICRNKLEEERRIIRSAELIKQIDDNAMGLLAKACERGGSNLPHMSEIFELFMRSMGGPQGYVNHVMASMLAAPAGGVTRQKYHDMMFRMSMKLSEGGHIEKNVEQMSDEEIFGKAAVVMRELQKRQREEQAKSPKPPPASSLASIESNGPKPS